MFTTTVLILVLLAAIQGAVSQALSAGTSTTTPPLTSSHNTGKHDGLELQSCSRWLMQPAAQERGDDGHGPWTHVPYCIPISIPRADTNGNMKGNNSKKDRRLCVFTNADFNGGQGISIVASPALAGKMVEEHLFDHELHVHVGSDDMPVKYEAIEKPGLGIGIYVRSSHQYKAGDIIMREYPTLIVPSGEVDDVSPGILDMLRWKALLQLSDGARKRTRALAQSKRMGKDEIVDIIETNAFTHEKGGGSHDMIFPEAARMNHNCIPNAVTRTNGSTLALEVIALRDVHPGEEIAHSYLDPSVEMDSRERATRLRSGWGFNCQCSLCSGNRARLRESDKRRHEISRTKASLETAKGDPGRILKYTETLLKLYEEEGMILPKADFFALAAHASMYLGERKKALDFSEEARQLWDVIFGVDSRESEDMRDFQRELGEV